MTRTSRGDRTTAEILDAAQAHLLAVGPENFSLREVARRAGLTPSALYNHFQDRDALITAVAVRSVGTLSTALEAVSAGPPVSRLRALGTAYVAFAQMRPAEYRVIFDCLINPPHDWNEYVQVAHPFSLIVAECERGLADGSIADRDGVGAAGLAFGLWSLVDGHAHLRAKHLAAISGDFDAMLGAAMDALLDGCRPHDDR